MKTKTLLMFLLHALIGLGISQGKSLGYYWGLSILAIGMADIFVSQNKNNEAGFWAAYYVGMEVFLRMTGGMISWEFGKFGFLLLLLAGILVETRKLNFPRAYVVYFALLIPSIFVGEYTTGDEARQQISFNLSGPLSLAGATIYFYNRPIDAAGMKLLMVGLLLPLAAMSVYLIIITPNTSDLVFTTKSNFKTSGGYGPNQVATALGLGLLLIGMALFYRFANSTSVIVDLLLLLLILFRGLVTFSRGGLIAAVITLAIMMALALFSGRDKSRLVLYSLFFVIASATIGYIIWDYANEATGKILTYRYIGINPVNNQEEDITSHRLTILEREWDWFKSNPLFGIGPGMEKVFPTETAGNHASSHSEITRLMAEHGMFGIAAFMILLIFPFRHFRKISNESKPMLIAFMVLALLTMSHSAMRLAIPGFLYGLSFIRPVFPSSKPVIKPVEPA